MRYFHFCYRILLLLPMTFMGAILSHAQTEDQSMRNNRSSSPSGSTSFLNANASVSPSLYTGGLELSLPIYTLKSTALQIPISITYTASNGVRPTDPNTVVGMDWMLMAGGSIKRQVRGLPDEVAYGYIGTNQEGAAVASDYNGNHLPFDNLYNIGQSQPVVDGEPDVFTVSTPFFNVQFTLDQNGKPVFEGGSSGFQVVDRLYNNTPGAETTGFTIIDPQGTQYLFGSQSSTRELTTTSFFGNSVQFISTWYLEKITTLNSKDVITLSYQEFTDEKVYSYQLNKLYTTDYSGSTFPPSGSPTGFTGVTNENVIVANNIYNGPKFVSQIVTRSGEADFTYTKNSNSYLDNSNPPYLSAIAIKQFNPITGGNTNLLQTYNFSFTDLETGIMGETPPYADTGVWADDYRRLLNTVTVTGNTSATATPLTLYNLKYYQSLPYCDRYLPQNLDYWGYQNSTQFLIDANNSDENWFLYPDQYRQPASYTPSGSSQSVPMAAIFALQELDQLGGQSTFFNYQQNDYYNGTSNIQAGGARVSSIVRQLPTGESLTTTYNYYDGSGHSTGQLWSNLYSHVRIFFGPNCCNLITVATSQSPYGISDDQGVMLGYSSVTATDPNAGYTVTRFSNFSDYPDVMTPISFFEYNLSFNDPAVCNTVSSFSYKRGLPMNVTKYKANGNAVSQDINTYGSVEALQGGTPAIKSIGLQDMMWYLSAPFYEGVNTYYQNIEDWRLMSTVHTDYDQLSVSRTLQTTTNYTYATDNRQVRSVSTTDSKGQNHTVTNYYADDANIPLATSTEQQTLATMASASINVTNPLINKADSRNGVVHQWHYTYAPLQIGSVTNYYLTTSASYTGTTPEMQQFMNYDVSTSQPISSNLTAGKSISRTFGYNSAYPIVHIENAANTASESTAPASLASNYFAFSSSTWNGQQQQFTITSAGTFSITLAQGVSGQNETFTYNLVGVTTGGVCMNSGSTTSCQFNSTYTWGSTIPAGTYTLIVTPGNPSSAPTNGNSVYVTYSVQGYSITPSGSTEYFFEGFEQNTAATAGSAHTGNMYYNASYSVPFTPPNSRQYVVQWWNLSGGQWVFNQMPYTTNMTLAGPLDDVRVFPIDALMTTYTYSPMLGKTSETDPSGRTTKYVYDGLGRLQQIIDQDGNILKQFDYEYQVGTQQ